MHFEKFYNDMNEHIKNKILFEKAKEYAYEYLDNIKDMEVFPCLDSLSMLNSLSQCLQALVYLRR